MNAMDKNIKTSVIIPIYNTEKYIDECIQSVLRQTQKEIEIILVDDGSTDGSRQIIEKYAEENPNVIAIHQENQKLGAARNAGIKVASGKYILLLDSDDYIAEDLLEKCHVIAEENETDIVFFDEYSVYENEANDIKCIEKGYDRSAWGNAERIMSGEEYWTNYFTKGGIKSVAWLNYIRKDFLLNNALFFEKGIFYEDADWTLRVYLKAKRVYYLPENLYYYRRSRVGSITNIEINPVHMKSLCSIMEKLTQLYRKETDMKKRLFIVDCAKAIMTRYMTNLDLLSDDSKKEKNRESIIAFLNYITENEVYLIEESGNFSLLVFQMYIDIVNKLCNHLPDVYNDKKKEYTDLLKRGFVAQTKLEEQIIVGIYGTGKMCDRMFDWYKDNELEINANMFFVVSDPQIKEYKGYPIYGVTEVKKICFDNFIISSEQYRYEMLKALEESDIKYKNLFVLPANIFRIGEN